MSPDRKNLQAPWAACSKCSDTLTTKRFFPRLNWNLYLSLWSLLLLLSLGITKSLAPYSCHLHEIPSQSSFLYTKQAQLPQSLFVRDASDPWILSGSSLYLETQ